MSIQTLQTTGDLVNRNVLSSFLLSNSDQNRPVAQAYSVSAMPTFLFLRNNSVIDTVRGANKADLTSKVQKHAGGSGSSGSGPAFTGQGNRLSGGSVSGTNATVAGAAQGVRALPETLRGMSRENLLPLVILAGYLFYVFFVKG